MTDNTSLPQKDLNNNRDLALYLAGAIGRAVFPCHEAPWIDAKEKNHKGKDPYWDKQDLPNGCKNATRDLDQVRSWWNRWPGALVGVACGPEHGIWCLDLDKKDGKNGFQDLANLAQGRKLPVGQAETTPSGGGHALFKYPQGMKIPTNNGELGPGLDLRGEGGYFCTGMLPDGTGYIPRPRQEFDKPLIDAAPWLLEAIAALEHKTVKEKKAQAAQPIQNDVDWAAGLLRRLDPWRCDNYSEWVSVGMALSGLGAAGLDLWDNWSKGSPKYTAGACADKWDTFKPGGLSLGSLYFWAEQDNPGGHIYAAPAGHQAQPEPPPGIDDIPEPPEFAELEGTTAAPKVTRPTKKIRWSAEEIMKTEFPEPVWAIPGLIPVGLSFLAGRPKVGKSWLALQFAVAVGCGGRALGEIVKVGKVLYLALEDSPRRLKKRMAAQGINPKNIDFVTEWNPLAAGGFTELQAEITAGGYSFVVIDTISRALGKSDQLDLTQMTLIMANLQNLSLTLDISILLVDHHTKPKGFGSDDPIDDIMGSTGKAAVCDVAIGLYKTQGKKGAILKARGRDVEDKELALEWDPTTCCWQNLGNAGDVRDDTFKGDILRAIRELKDDGELPTTAAIAKYTGKDASNVSHALADLLAAGKVRQGTAQGTKKPYEVV